MIINRGISTIIIKRDISAKWIRKFPPQERKTNIPQSQTSKPTQNGKFRWENNCFKTCANKQKTCVIFVSKFACLHNWCKFHHACSPRTKWKSAISQCCGMLPKYLKCRYPKVWELKFLIVNPICQPWSLKGGFLQAEYPKHVRPRGHIFFWLSNHTCQPWNLQQ